MIDREKIDELGYLNVQRNREGFLTNKLTSQNQLVQLIFAIMHYLVLTDLYFQNLGKIQLNR